jgi:hypothetical protein
MVDFEGIRIRGLENNRLITVTVTDADTGRKLRVFNIITITTQGSTKHT